MQNKTLFPRSFCEALQTDFPVHRSIAGGSILSTMRIVRLQVLRGSHSKPGEGIARLHIIEPKCGLLDGKE